MKLLQPRKALNKGYLRAPIDNDSYNTFIDSLATLRSNIKVGQNEETQKGYFKDFLRDTFYGDYKIDTTERIDLAIRLNNRPNSNIGVMFEFKALGKPDMPKTDNLNSKALRELVLYYMQQRESGNDELRNLVITNTDEFFVFNAQEFERLFYRNSDFHKKFIDFEEERLPGTTTDYFYDTIASPRIDEIKDNLEFTHFKLSDFKSDIKKRSRKGKLTHLYRIFSPVHLLKEKFQNDSNSLNDKFYKELLHLIGLEEKKVNNKLVIQRKGKSQRELASLLENAIDILRAENHKKSSETEEEYEERLFGIAMELCIVWINRILFLKLLEAQLSNYHIDKAYKFLTYDRIMDFDTLHRLFIQVLAVDMDNRSDVIKNQFPEVPYLNSSLFDLTETERRYIRISGLSQTEKLPLLNKSVLKNDPDFNNKKELPFLQYLFAFLDAYNFSSEGIGDVADTPKTLINASVLGLIFEKINGYKDGAVFTPGFITKYMCETAIRQAIIDKFNKHYNRHIESFEGLLNEDYDSKEMNDLINSLTICDPAVGSGHFLVSALNEIILIKFQLNCLFDTNGNRIKKTDYDITVENDELIISDKDGELWQYHPNNEESRRIQEAIFNEKRTIIENCLFGVDINPNSVNICRLRLWIELLKNAYYTEESDYKKLETLPNIDINIKCGNSLLQKYGIKGDIENQNIKNYKEAVKKYKSVKSKEAKSDINNLIVEIKAKFADKISMESDVMKKYKQAEREWFNARQVKLFDDEKPAKLKKQDEQKLKEATKKYVLAKAAKDEAFMNPIFKEGFEWRMEFPEILDDNGNFIGFDIVIGNPPYGVSIKGDYRNIATSNLGKVPDFEIYYLFIELANLLLKRGGIISYIIPNSWLFNVFARGYRLNLFDKWHLDRILDLTYIPIFSSAGVRNTIIQWKSKEKSEECNSQSSYKCTRNIATFEELMSQPDNSISKEQLIGLNHNWALAFLLPDSVISLIHKISGAHNSLKDFYDVSQGYIPYRKSDLVNKFGKDIGEKIADERQWHASTKINEFYIQEIHGKDISRYNYQSSGEFVKYGPHLATYVDLKYFNQARLLVREITNPGIIATYIEDLYVNDPQLISIIPKSAENSLIFLWAILNSKLATFYHFNHSPKATKGLFPKILVTDLNDFPIPEIKEEVIPRVETIVREILKLKREYPEADVKALENELDLIVYYLYGLSYSEAKIIDSEITLSEEDYYNYNPRH